MADEYDEVDTVLDGDATHVQIDPDTGFVSGLLEEAAPAPSSGGSLEQVREILFGARSRNLEHKLAALEERLELALAGLSEQGARRVDDLERYIKNELAALIEKLGAQREERMVLFQQLKAEVDHLRQEAVDRAALSASLGEVAARLAALPSPLGVAAPESAPHRR
jgi:hypothetical protein